ncbi:MAG: 2-C-methyl-D-erythritol 2,4-cyclodiphosphate synthase [Chloroflexi bacterium]|nr:2-C-methyl-D-erythritol 2,4-cyclodiphosphate synthase [Chloroflexota bacterium]MBT7081157.1 2-C-methyl-D-erythritol 2,4-cyclodiphosphate synthase [Chloroflexota bacterium]
MRVGIGYDVHSLTEGEKLVLGGVEIKYNLGLAGWSDADVLVHSIMDALLGAAGLADIGTYFPPSDPAYKNVSSLALLQKIKAMLDQDDWKIVNIDSTIIAEQPKLAPYTDQMKQSISNVLEINKSQIGIKATTTEKMGFTGRGEGIAAQAVALIDKK